MNALVLSAIWGVIMMFSGILTKRLATVRVVALLGIVALLVSTLMELNGIDIFKFDARRMLLFDNFSLLFNAVIFTCVLIYFLLSGKDIEKVGMDVAEYYALLFFILVGVSIASSFNTLLMLFLGIEIISIPLYILTGSDKRNLKSNEASLKYFLMGSFSTGLMLMGITLIYGAKGSFDMDTIALGTGPLTPMVGAGMLLLMFSMAFKVSAAPFHFWTPDVYDGAPTVYTSFMATIVKAAAFIAFIRLFQGGFSNFLPEWKMVAAIVTALTLLIGN